MNKMKGTKLKVFSILQNCNTLMTKQTDMVLNTVVSGMWFERSPGFVKEHCKRIWNEIENGFYEYDELTIHAIWIQWLTGKRVKMSDINRKSVDLTMDLFTTKRYKIDQQFIVDMNEQVQLDNIQAYFKINVSGRCLVYSLVRECHISPIFFIKLYKKSQPETKIEKSKECLRFEFTMKKLEKLLDLRRTRMYIDTKRFGRCNMA